MVQIGSSPALSVQLTPMQIPEMEAPGSNLLLHPGEPSEMIVHIKNLGLSNLRLNLRVEGDFPSQWCQIGGTEGNELTPGGQMDAVLYFQVPASYFEDQQAIAPDRKERLTLNFPTRLVVYSLTETEQEPIEEVQFTLYIRPWTDYMDFLPVFYREVDFISRFMKIFEQAYQPVIDSFAVMWANLDPLTAPRALLPFLAHWVAWPVDSVWNLPQQRRLIRRAMELYRWRGTRKGLRLYLHLYTGLPLDEHLPDEGDKHISITESFGQMLVLGDSYMGEAVLGGGQAYHFVVRLRPESSHYINEQLIRRIIDQEKPAFCTYELFIENSITS